MSDMHELYLELNQVLIIEKHLSQCKILVKVTAQFYLGKFSLLGNEEEASGCLC